MARIYQKESKDDFLDYIPHKMNVENVNLRKTLKDEMNRGATHTEIAIKLLNNEDIKLRINPKIFTPDAVIAKFVLENPKLALENKDVLIEASKMNYNFENPNHKAFAVWALISSHMFYPEISYKHFAGHPNIESAELHLKELYANLEKVLKEEAGDHIKVIAQFTDLMAKETATVRNYLNEEVGRLGLVCQEPEKTLDMLHKRGYKVVALREDERLDPFVLNIASTPKEEKTFVIVKKSGERLKVSLRAVNGRLGANLYRTLNEEERKARKSNDLPDEWNGSQIAGGSPLDGTAIKFERIALILSAHSA